MQALYAIATDPSLRDWCLATAAFFAVIGAGLCVGTAFTPTPASLPNSSATPPEPAGVPAAPAAQSATA